MDIARMFFVKGRHLVQFQRAFHPKVREGEGVFVEQMPRPGFLAAYPPWDRWDHKVVLWTEILTQAPVDAKVYFAWGSNDKAYELDTKIVSCHDDQYRVYPVYYLSPVSSCGALGFNILHCANLFTWA